MKLIPDSDPLLKEKSISYTKEEIKSLGTQTFVNELFSCMIDHGGCGIAAVQVGVLKRVICIKTDDLIEILFNPVVLKQSGKCVMTEGCLSFPGVYKDISRSEKITVKWLDRQAKVNYADFTGLTARAILHECDHLNGVVFLEK